MEKYLQQKQNRLEMETEYNLQKELHESQHNEEDAMSDDEWEEMVENFFEKKEKRKRENLIEKRNNVVRKYDKKMAWFRTIREEGKSLTKEQFKEWDKIREEMNIELAPIDHELFINGWL